MSEDLPRYKDFQPTGFDRHIEVEGIEDFIVVIGRSRDSTILDNSNFYAALEMLGGESEQVQVHRFGHWGTGWFELLLVHPDREEECYEIAGALANYAILDEEDYSHQCYESILDYWERLPMKERMRYCVNARESIFGARKETPSDRVYQRLSDEIY